MLTMRFYLRTVFACLFLTIAIFYGSSTPAQSQSAVASQINFGAYHALIIGINDYKDLKDLGTAEADARALAAVLQDKYGFSIELLLNPSRGDIVDKLDELRGKLKFKDNLLIYYAGHGWIDDKTNEGFWLPADAKSNRRSNWISNSTITNSLKGFDAKHVMVVANSCYSGRLVRSSKITLPDSNYFSKMARKKTRVVLTSGGLEPVADSDGSGHSPFSSALLRVLNANESILDGNTLFNAIRTPVMLNTDQTPEYSNVHRAGHDGGDFLFVRAGLSPTVGTAASQPAAVPASETNVEVTYWQSIEDSAIPEAFDAYLKRYPSGRFAELARIKREHLVTEAKAQADAQAQAVAQAKADAKARAEAEARRRAEAEARLQAEARAKIEAEARAEAETRARIEAETRAKIEEERRQQQAATAQAQNAAQSEVAALPTPANSNVGNLARFKGRWDFTSECEPYSANGSGEFDGKEKYAGNVHAGDQNYYLVSYVSKDGKIEGTGTSQQTMMQVKGEVVDWDKGIAKGTVSVGGEGY